MKAKFNYNDKVTFMFNGVYRTGTIKQIDYGIYLDPDNIYYDIQSKDNSLYKHVWESEIDLINQ